VAVSANKDTQKNENISHYKNHPYIHALLLHMKSPSPKWPNCVEWGVKLYSLTTYEVFENLSKIRNQHTS